MGSNCEGGQCQTEQDSAANDQKSLSPGIAPGAQSNGRQKRACASETQEESLSLSANFQDVHREYRH